MSHETDSLGCIWWSHRTVPNLLFLQAHIWLHEATVLVLPTDRMLLALVGGSQACQLNMLHCTGQTVRNKEWCGLQCVESHGWEITAKSKVLSRHSFSRRHNFLLAQSASDLNFQGNWPADYILVAQTAWPQSLCFLTRLACSTWSVKVKTLYFGSMNPPWEALGSSPGSFPSHKLSHQPTSEPGPCINSIEWKFPPPAKQPLEKQGGTPFCF